MGSSAFADVPMMPSDPVKPRYGDQNLAPARIPKLTYRNRLPEPLSPSESVDQSSAAGASTSPHSRLQTNTPDVLDTRQSRYAREASAEPPQGAPRRSSAGVAMERSGASSSTSDTKRKKHNSLLGLFTLKEPSTSALEEYKKQQQKQAAAKGGRMTAVGMPGTSSQKLPPTVPKVNSKWDGLPSPAKDKAKDVRSSQRGSALTVASHTSATSSATMSSKASISSGDSVRSRSKLSSSKRPSTYDKTDSATHSPLPSVNEVIAEASHDRAPASSRPISSRSRTQEDDAPQSQTANDSQNRKQRTDSVAGSVVAIPPQSKVPHEHDNTSCHIEPGVTKDSRNKQPETGIIASSVKFSDSYNIALYRQGSSGLVIDRKKSPKPVVNEGQGYFCQTVGSFTTRDMGESPTGLHERLFTTVEAVPLPDRSQSNRPHISSAGGIRSRPPVVSKDVLPWESQSPVAQQPPSLPSAGNEKKRRHGIMKKNR